uniref:lipopolysaccharide biosynthesis protein n=1 Tax=Roseovarius sp. BRH_c41 TaxID=1629709 RepID=UPI000AA44BD3|nr:hypothetical protein [Roseovarius sp. BRH_c41]
MVMKQGAVGRFVTNVGASLLGAILNLIILIWVNQFLLRRVGAEEYSLVPVLTSLMIFGELFRDAFAGGVARFLVAADASGDDTEVARIVSSMLPLLALVALIVATGGGWAVQHIDQLINVDAAHKHSAQIMLSLLVLSLCLEIAASPFSFGLFAKMRFVTLNLVNFGTLLVRIALLLVFLFGIGPQVIWLVVATVLSSLLDLAIRIYFTIRLLPAARFNHRLISRRAVATLLSFSLWTTVQGIGNIVHRATPALFLNHYSNPVDVVSFHLGNLPDLQIRKLISVGARPALPELTSVFVSGRKEALRGLFYRGGRYYLWAALFLPPSLIIFGGPLVTLYVGPNYLDAATVLIWVLGAYPLVWASAMFFQVAYASGEIRAFNILNIIVVLATLAMLWIFIVWLDMGALGAGYAFGIGSGLGHLLIIWPGSLRFIQGSWIDFIRLTLGPGCLPGLIAILICVGWTHSMALDSWAMLGVGFCLASAGYVTTLLVCCLDAQDKVLLGKLKSRLLRRG